MKSGYKYTNFFHIESLKPNRNIADKDDTILNIKLFVLATKDAHILLSPTDQIKSSPIYEIGLYFSNKIANHCLLISHSNDAFG